jgi:hypothetical protein
VVAEQIETRKESVTAAVFASRAATASINR